MKRMALTFLLTALLAAVYGCGGKPAQNGHTVIRIAGSTSMMPVSEKLARAYEQKHPGIKIDLEGGDSSLGIKGVSSGIVEIGSISRPLTAEESNSLKPYKIAEDSVCVIVSDKNPVGKLTLQQAREVFSGKISNWGQVGGLNKPITVIGREAGSGTHSVFQDLVMGGEAVEEKALVMTSTGSVVSAVIRDINSIGYISSNYQPGGIKKVEIHTGQNSVFELSRPLLYVVRPGADRNTLEYLDFCTGAEGKKIIRSYQEQ